VSSDTTRSGDLESGPPEEDGRPEAGACRANRAKRRLPLNGPALYDSIYCRLLGKATPMLAHTLRRYAVTSIAVSVLALSTTACAGDDDPETAPTDEPTSSATGSTSEPTTSPTPTTDPDAWRSKFSPAQLEAYDVALQRWESYESRSEPIWAKGEATPAAEKLFKEFFPHPIWIGQFKQLQTYEQYEVRIAGTPDVLWSRAKSIGDSGGGVEIEQCVDYRSTTTTQNGEPTKPIESRQQPVLREITMSKPKGYDWLIYAINATPGAGGKKDRPCGPTP
jgi:hypothetical protein